MDSNSLWARKLILTFLKGAKRLNFQRFSKRGISLFVQNSLEAPPKKLMQDAKLKSISKNILFAIDHFNSKKKKDGNFFALIFSTWLWEILWLNPGFPHKVIHYMTPHYHKYSICVHYLKCPMTSLILLRLSRQISTASFQNVEETLSQVVTSSWHSGMHNLLNYGLLYYSKPVQAWQ